MATSKEELETEKLSAEIKHLKRPFYAAPTFWISVVTALVAVAGVVGQSVLSKLERAQAVVDRDRALLAHERAQKELAGVEAERSAKRKEVDVLAAEATALRAEGETLRLENANQAAKLTCLISALASAPQASRSLEVNAAVKVASKSLFATAVYSLNVDAAKVSKAVASLRAAGYSLIKVESLSSRTAWLSPVSVVLYYDDSTADEAKLVAALVTAQIGANVGVQKGAGSGIPPGREKTSLRVHIVQ